MSGFANPIIGGGGALVYPSIHSPNFITTISGWTIKKDGSAEFNNLTIRGSFLGTNFVINSLGAFFYSGAPATGNLIASIAGAAGADDGHGNAFRKGVTSYGAGGSFLNMLNNLFSIGANAADFGANLSGGGGQLNIASGISAVGDTNASVVLISKFLTLGGAIPQVVIGPTATPVPVTSQTLEVQGTMDVNDILAIINGAEETWHYVGGANALGTAFGAAWGNLGGTSANLAFRRVPSPAKEVEIKGVIATTGIAPNNNIFTLPAGLGYRPANDQRFPAATSAAAAAACLVQVSAAGVVQVSGAPGGVATTIGVDVRVSLDL